MVNKGKNKKNNASTRDALYDVMYMKNTSIRIALPQTDPYLHKHYKNMKDFTHRLPINDTGL